MDAAVNLTLACALEVEEKAARRGGATAVRIGLGATRPLPDGPVASFGLAGALVHGIAPGTVLTTRRIVDEGGRLLWEGEPISVPGAVEAAVVCAAGRLVDDPDDRRALAERTGAVAVDLETGALAASGRLAGWLRAVADGPERPLGALAHGATEDGGVAWGAVARAFAREPLRATRVTFAARKALAALQEAAAALVKEAA